MGLGTPIKDCVANGNGNGIGAPDRCQMMNCISTENIGSGFDCASYVTMTECTASRKGGNGIVVLGTAAVLRGSATHNDLRGIYAGIGPKLMAAAMPRTTAANTGVVFIRRARGEAKREDRRLRQSSKAIYARRRSNLRRCAQPLFAVSSDRCFVVDADAAQEGTAIHPTARDSLAMIAFIRSPMLALALLSTPFANHPAEAAPADKGRSKQDLEAATRLQVFLDRAEFAPGKIDGRYGEFTVKALALYRTSKGESSPPVPAEKIRAKKTPKQSTAPDLSGLDLASIDPVFITYTVTEADLQSIGEVPASVPEQAKKKSLPYKTAAEAIAEKFHTDVDFLAELNPGKTNTIKAGDTLTVPNVEPFDLPAVKDLKAGSEIPANDLDEAADEKKSNADTEGNDAKTPPPTTSVKVDTKTNMLAIYEGEQLIAAYPVTIGSAKTSSPVGEWLVRGVAKMPNFRYDKAMLTKGERSSDFHMLPPGPNNPVGIIWIQLNKKGIGLHGTGTPDAIGRNASHGCVRLANWDVVRLAAKVKTGVPVSIH